MSFSYGAGMVMAHFAENGSFRWLGPSPVYSAKMASRFPSSLLKKVSGTLKACEKPGTYAAGKVPDTFLNRLLTDLPASFENTSGILVVPALDFQAEPGTRVSP